MLDPPTQHRVAHDCARTSPTDAEPHPDVLPSPDHPPAVVALTGELDVLTAPDVRRVLQDAGADGDVVVDLSEVTFIDCSNLGTLLEARNRLGSRLSLRACSRPVQRLLALTGLCDAFTLVDAEPHAPRVRTPRQRTAGPSGAAPSDRDPAPQRR
jgi:anti-anti-sigma factor